MSTFIANDDGLKIELILGDCQIESLKVPENSVQLILTDPPYGIDYSGRGRPKEIIRDRLVNDADEMNLQFLLSRPELKIVWGAQNFLRQLPNLGRWLCWDKRLTEKADKMLGSAFELAWCSRESGYYKMYRVLHGGSYNADAFGVRRVHPTQKPAKLMRKIIEDFTKPGDTVFDPFMGSGTTGIASRQMGRSFIGIEIAPNYFEIACRKIKETQPILFSTEE